MNILFVGVLDVKWSTNVEMKKALLALGHEVDDYNYRTKEAQLLPTWQKNVFFAVFINRLFSFIRRFDGLPIPLQNLYYFVRGRKKMNSDLIVKAKSRNYDLVLFTKTDTVSPKTIAVISQMTNTWYYFMDPMDQAWRINAMRYARCTTFASATFSDVYKQFKENNPNSYWMTQGIDTDVFSPKKDVQKTIDVMFAGTKTGKREAAIKEIRARGIQIACYGKGWENPQIYRKELVDCYCRSKIVLNLCRGGSGFSVRVLQVMGAGAFLLSEYCPDLEQVFQKKKHLDWANSSSELAEKVEYYLKNQEQAESIAAEGCAYVHKEKNWKRLMVELTSQTKV